jgi:hypothetical protein
LGEDIFKTLMVGEDIFKTLLVGEDIATISHNIVSPYLESMNKRC